jgi:hypothetical protein
MMANRLYLFLGLFSLTALILVLLNRDKILFEALMWIVSILFMLIVAAIHGVLAHSIRPAAKGNLIFYPIMMGILFGILSAIYFFFIMPMIMN